jgi:hypothetical protein
LKYQQILKIIVRLFLLRRNLVALLAVLLVLKSCTVTWRVLDFAQAVNGMRMLPRLGLLAERTSTLQRTYNALNGEIGFMYPLLDRLPGRIGDVPEIVALSSALIDAAQPIAGLGASLESLVRAPTFAKIRGVVREAGSLPWHGMSQRVVRASPHMGALIGLVGLGVQVFAWVVG